MVALLPADTCPLAEVSRVVDYLAAEGAGQCGPCVHGLATLAGQVGSLAEGGPGSGVDLAEVDAVCRLVEGRGACRHLDGVVRFVRTALATFADHVARHRRAGACTLPDRPVLPVPARAPVGVPEPVGVPGGWR